MRPAPGKPVDHIVPFGQPVEQQADVLRLVLQVIVHRHDHTVACDPNSTEERVMLTKVPHERNSANPLVAMAELLDNRPAMIRAAVVDQHNLVFFREAGQGFRERCRKLGQAFALRYTGTTTEIEAILAPGAVASFSMDSID